MRQNPIIGVYSITHEPTGRVYVGGSANVYRRWRWHRGALNRRDHANQPLIADWHTFGSDQFRFDLLEVVANADDLLEREQHWIDTLNATHPDSGYNLHPNAGSPSGYTLSLEHRARISSGLRGRTHTDATKAKMSHSMAGNQNGRGKHYHGVLAESDVVEIRRCVARGETHTAIAARYGVSRPTITRIANRRTWWNVSGSSEVTHDR